VAAVLAGHVAGNASAALRSDQFGLGAVGRMHTLSQAEIARELDGYRAVGARWIRFDIDWSVIQAGGRSSYNWAPFDTIVRAARARRLNVLGMIAYTPAWARPPRTTDKTPPTSTADYARFAGAVARRYGPMGVRHFQIWNEPNIATFWVPRPNPAGYARMLKEASAAIKRANPNAFVVTAGLAPAWTDGTSYTAMDFLAALYANGAGPSFDAYAHHASTFPAFPSEQQIWNSWWRMIGTDPSIRGVMIANGDADKKVWITEFSAPTGSDRAVSETVQAEMLTEGYQMWGSFEWAGPLFWWSYRDGRSNPTYWHDYCGLLRRDFSRKPSFYAYRALADAAAR
jgi:polysaccharide biosynthesis protein PslG